MSKVTEAQKILNALGLPPAQQNDISVLTLLALCGIGPRDKWENAQRRSLTISKGVMLFIREKYRRTYAPNTRETFRRQVLHQFVHGHIVDYNPDNPSLATNSPLAHYALTEAALAAVRTFGTDKWKQAVIDFHKRHGALCEIYQGKREHALVPIVLPDGQKLTLSPGEHNSLQAAIIEQFAPRFAPGASLLYLGDTANKGLFIDPEKLGALRVAITEHDKLPDVILYDNRQKWLFLIEAVTSHGPMSPKRVYELKKVFSSCPLFKVFVSAFPDFSEFRNHMKDIAWETEVWLAEIPDHLIHYNGDKFLGPRSV